jgi:transcriptional regulator with XRE-family HTH domain
VDRVLLSDFLRARRAATQPEDVGLPRGPRRRTPGLRRDEVAHLSGVSTDYYTRLEQPHGQTPSAQVLDAIARGMRLSTVDRDHLRQLAGYPAVVDAGGSREVGPGLRRIFERLAHEPALVVSDLGETLLQTKPAVALLGDETRYAGAEGSRVYRWFTDPHARRHSPAEDHAAHSLALVAQLTGAVARSGPDSSAATIAQQLNKRSAEFAALWQLQPVSATYCEPKRFLHRSIGEMTLHGQTLLDPDRRQALTVFTAAPGTVHEQRLRRLLERAQQSADDDLVLTGP